MPSPEVLTPGQVDVVEGNVNRFQGISAAIDGTTASQLDVTVAANGWALLGDGTLLHTALTAPLASVNLPGNTVTGSYTLYLTYSWVLGNLTPSFYVALTSVGPTNTYDLVIASFAVSASVITTGSVLASPAPKRGLQFLQTAIVFGTATYAMGTLPANAVIDFVITNTTTAFTAGTNNQYEIGKTGTLNAYGTSSTTALATASTVFFPALAGSVGASAVPVILTTLLTGSTAGAGAATVTLVFHQP